MRTRMRDLHILELGGQAFVEGECACTCAGPEMRLTQAMFFGNEIFIETHAPSTRK